MLKTPMYSLSSKIKNYFSADPFFFWTILFLMSANAVASLFYVQEWVNFCITIAVVYCSACIMSALLSSLGCVGKILKYLSITFFVMYDVLALFCIVVFKSALNATVIESILTTNINEIKEFVVVFTPWWLALVVALLLTTLFYVHHLFNKKYCIRMGASQCRAHCYVLTYIVIVILICNKQVGSRISEMKSWTIPFENIAINLKDHEPKHILLKENTNIHPEKIVLIIGESHSKGHSSIYGYDKDTNPRVRTLMQDSLLFAFQNVSSPATATVQSFKYILNTRRVGDTLDEWYEFPSIISILKSAGYRSSWFSNQDEVGLYDNLASCYAHLCDTYYFNNSEERYDGDLLSCRKQKNGKEFIVYHLMGQHVDFSKRYPKSFTKFKPEQYDIRKYAKRDIAAHYDNACLYNDYVVSEIMNQYKDDDAVVIYFPDHGLDVFQSSPYYFGHAYGMKKNSGKVGYQIPFFIYMSRRYQDKKEEMVQQIKHSLQKKYCTADITFTLMHIAGYDFVGVPSIRKYSIVD